MFYGKRRSTRFRRTGGGFRRGGVPVAQRQRYWIQTQNSGVTESGTDVTALDILVWASIPGLGSMAALSRGVRLKRTLILLETTPAATSQSRIFGVALDDISDSANAGLRWNPSDPTAANQRVPDRVFRWGAIYTPPTATSLVPAVFYNNLDAVRDIKLNGFFRPDQALSLYISPASGTTLTYTIRSRTLIEIG